MDLEVTKKEVFGWIDGHRAEIIQFLMDFIGYKSPTEHELDVQRDFLMPFFEEEMKFDEIDYFSEAPTERTLTGHGEDEGAGKTCC